MTTVVVAGGGTGGHIFPGVAIARELKERWPGCEVVFVGTRLGLESRIVPAEGFRLMTIRSSGITGKSLAARLKGMTLVPLSLVQSWALLGRLRPALVIGVGGYSSGPVLAAAVARRAPTLIHEQNVVPGLTNRWLAPFVRQVAVTFAETVERMGGRGVVTGNPVRRDFALVQQRGFDEPVKRLLVIGGSRGARAINRAVRDALPRLAAMKGSLRITHQTGDLDHQEVLEAYGASAFDADEYDVRPFISGMSHAFDQADLIVSRCGSTALAELTVAGRPAVLVPFAAATHDHQTFNALKLVEADAAVMIPESDLDGARLSTVVMDLLADPGRLSGMAVAARKLGRPDAATRIADLCEAMLAEGRAA